VSRWGKTIKGIRISFVHPTVPGHETKPGVYIGCSQASEFNLEELGLLKRYIQQAAGLLYEAEAKNARTEDVQVPTRLSTEES
jgi:hypothetical protein